MITFTMSSTVLAIMVLLAEAQGAATQQYFECADGSKFTQRGYLCDGDKDCPDGSDETKEMCGNCTSSEFLCASEVQCIRASATCDGYSNCRDGSDEHTTICGVECADGSKIINKGYQCDGDEDCPDGSDETKELCGNCTSSEFLCASEVQCISASSTCDGYSHCRDGSDEHTTICGNCTSSQFACADGLQCIPARHKCNTGSPDCKDGSDEDLSTCGCASYQFKCADGEQCVPSDYTCNGYRDCRDGSDETIEGSCQLDENGCSSKEFCCADGREYIRAVYKCDGYNDCGDASDESASVCVANVNIIKVGTGEVHQIKRMGVYTKTEETVQGHPIYEQKVQKLNHRQFLFVGPDRNWRVGPDTSTWRGTGLKNEHLSLTPPKTGWQHFEDGDWVMDYSIELLELPKVLRVDVVNEAEEEEEREEVNAERDCVLEDNMDYAGNDILGILSGYESKEKCAKLCGDTEGCKFWTFVKSSEGCWLKEDGSVKAPNNCPGCISGTRGCAEEGEEVPDLERLDE